MSTLILHYADLETCFDDPVRLGKVVSRLRTSPDQCPIVVGSGDVLAPSVLGMVHDGRQTLPFYEAVEPDAETFGNHDFDVGLDAVRAVVAESPHEWVSANVYHDGSRFAEVAPSTLVCRGETTVGIVGVTDPRTSVPEELTIAPPVDATADAAAPLTAEADYVVVTAHARRDLARDLAALDAVDVVLTGHLHTAAVARVDGTPVVEAGANGEVIQAVSLAEPVSVTTQAVADADRAWTVERALTSLKADAGLSDVVARADDPIRCERDRCLNGPCRIGQLVAEAYRWAGDADVGIIDTRALRDRPPLAGAVTAFDLISVVPFDGPLFVCSLSGRELTSLLGGAMRTGDGYRKRGPGTVDWMAQCSGVDVAVDAEGTITRLHVDGTPVDTDAQYRIATNPYVVGAETEFEAVGPEDIVAEEGQQFDAVVDYVRACGLSPAGGAPR